MPNFHLVKIDEDEPVQAFTREEMEKEFGIHYTIYRAAVRDRSMPWKHDEDETSLVVAEYPGKSLTETHFNFPIFDSAKEALADARQYEGKKLNRDIVREVKPLEKSAEEFKVYGHRLAEGTKIWTAGRGGPNGFGPFTIQETHVDHVAFTGNGGGTYRFTNVTPDGRAFSFNKDGYQISFTRRDSELEKRSVDSSEQRAFTRLEDVVAYAKAIAPKFENDFDVARDNLKHARDEEVEARQAYEGVQKYAEQDDRVLGAVPAP